MQPQTTHLSVALYGETRFLVDIAFCSTFTRHFRHDGLLPEAVASLTCLDNDACILHELIVLGDTLFKRCKG